MQLLVSAGSMLDGRRRKRREFLTGHRSGINLQGASKDSLMGGKPGVRRTSTFTLHRAWS